MFRAAESCLLRGRCSQAPIQSPHPPTPPPAPSSGSTPLKVAWRTLGNPTQTAIEEAGESAAQSTVSLGPGRVVTIGEVLVWSKVLGPKFASSVLLTLNPAGYSGGMLKRMQKLNLEAKELGPHYKKYAESDVCDYLMTDASAERLPLQRLRSGEACCPPRNLPYCISFTDSLSRMSTGPPLAAPAASAEAEAAEWEWVAARVAQEDLGPEALATF